MILAIIIITIYIGIVIAAIIGIGYFFIKRIEEKKREKDILERDDY